MSMHLGWVGLLASLFHMEANRQADWTGRSGSGLQLRELAFDTISYGLLLSWICFEISLLGVRIVWVRGEGGRKTMIQPERWVRGAMCISPCVSGGFFLFLTLLFVRLNHFLDFKLLYRDFSKTIIIFILEREFELISTWPLFLTHVQALSSRYPSFQPSKAAYT